MSLPENAYNCGLIRHQGKLLLVCRAHDRSDWRTNLYMASLDESLNPIECRKIAPPLEFQDQSHEDARLYEFKGKLWMAWVVGQWNTASHRCAVAFGLLENGEDGWQISRHQVPAWGNNDFSGMQKSWLPFEHEEKLWCYYRSTEATQAFIKFDGGGVKETVESRPLPWNYGPIHGGAITRKPDGKLLFFFNSRTGGNDRTLHRYHVGCAELDGKPPFPMLRISNKPILYGQEGYNLNGHKWFKPNVCFCAGAIMDNGRILLSYGWNDSQCRIAVLKESELNL